jgi:hypothetical protein
MRMKTLEDGMRRGALSPQNAEDINLMRGRPEDRWRKTTDKGKTGYTSIIGVLTNGSAVKPTCVCV